MIGEIRAKKEREERIGPRLMLYFLVKEKTSHVRFLIKRSFSYVLLSSNANSYSLHPVIPNAPFTIHLLFFLAINHLGTFETV